MEDKFAKCFAKCLTGFRKSHGTQHSLLTMLDKWKRGIDMDRISLPYLWTFQRPLIQSTMTSC